MINAVTRKKKRHLIIQTSRAHFHTQVRKNLGKSRNRIIDVFLGKISEKNDLRSTRNDRNKLRQRCINVIQDDNIDLMILRQNLRDKSRNRQDRRDQIPRQGELRIQRGQRMLVRQLIQARSKPEDRSLRLGFGLGEGVRSLAELK